MAQEDDLRALGKIMDFLRAVSIILVVMNVYWFCYEAIRLWGVNIGVVDKILLNFDRTAVYFIPFSIQNCSRSYSWLSHAWEPRA